MQRWCSSNHGIQFGPVLGSGEQFLHGVISPFLHICLPVLLSTLTVTTLTFLYLAAVKKLLFRAVFWSQSPPLWPSCFFFLFGCHSTSLVVDRGTSLMCLKRVSHNQPCSGQQSVSSFGLEEFGSHSLSRSKELWGLVVQRFTFSFKFRDCGGYLYLHLDIASSGPWWCWTWSVLAARCNQFGYLSFLGNAWSLASVFFCKNIGFDEFVALCEL